MALTEQISIQHLFLFIKLEELNLVYTYEYFNTTLVFIYLIAMVSGLSEE